MSLEFTHVVSAAQWVREHVQTRLSCLHLLIRQARYRRHMKKKKMKTKRDQKFKIHTQWTVRCATVQQTPTAEASHIFGKQMREKESESNWLNV